MYILKRRKKTKIKNMDAAWVAL